MTATKFSPTKFLKFLDGKELVHGVGFGAEHACSVAQVNLFLTGTLTDNIPDCMNDVIGEFIIPLQDSLPLDILNSREYRVALSRVAGTGKGNDDAHRAVILDWLFGTVLPELQPVADAHGFGVEWTTMCELRTYAAAYAAADAAADAAAWSKFDAPGLLTRLSQVNA